MLSKQLNFRARTLDAAKPMAVYFAEDLPGLSELNAINRSVPAMPSGMEKEEEAEKHLQDILELQEKDKTNSSVAAAELMIPTPEVYVASDLDGTYSTIYKGTFKLPRAYIHVQPFSADQDLPDYDLDSEDEAFLQEVLREQKKFEVDAITLEDMLDRLERNSGHNVVSAKEAKLLLKEDDELILAVYDYWVDKRLRLKQPLIPCVRSDKRDGMCTAAVMPNSGLSSSGMTGSANSGGGSSAKASAAGGSSSNPYIAFRRRTEKMQTRKNRKNDETSYEKMLKLRRDLSRAVTLLEMVKRREKTKKENLNLTADIFERRYQAGDYEGKIIADVLAQRQHRILQPTYTKAENWLNNQSMAAAAAAAAAAEGHRQRRPYSKKKRHKSHHKRSSNGPPDFNTLLGNAAVVGSSGDEDDDDGDRSASGASPSDADVDDEAEWPFTFRRKRNCQYLAPLMDELGVEPHRGWPWDAPEDGGTGEAKYRYSLASLSSPMPRCVGMVRRRVGRGGRIVLDRAFSNYDELWRSLDFTVTNGCGVGTGGGGEAELGFDEWPHYRPVTPPHCREEPDYDPYKLRLSETPVGLPTQPIKPALAAAAAAAAQQQQQQQRGRIPTTNGLGLRTVSMDATVAHNAASALVTSDTFDLISGILSQQQVQVPHHLQQSSSNG